MIGDRAHNPSVAPAVFNKPMLREAQDETPSASPVLVALPAVAAGIVTCIGFVVLLGWPFDIWLSKSIFRGLDAMKPISGVGFVLSGIVLYLTLRGALTPARRHLLLALAVLVLSLGIVSIIRVGFGTDLFVGNFLIVHGWPADATKPMSVVTGLEFAVFGAAMLVSQRNDLAFVTLTFVGMLISLLVFTGYLYDLPIFYAPLGVSSNFAGRLRGLFRSLRRGGINSSQYRLGRTAGPRLDYWRLRTVVAAGNCHPPPRHWMGAYSGHKKLDNHRRSRGATICTFWPLSDPFGLADGSYRQSPGSAPRASRPTGGAFAGSTCLSRGGGCG